MSLPLSVSSLDYDGFSLILTFESCDTRQCTSVTIIDDQVLEATETFFANLTRTGGLDIRITLDPVVAVVSIVDNDSELYLEGSMCVAK